MIHTNEDRQKICFRKTLVAIEIETGFRLDFVLMYTIFEVTCMKGLQAQFGFQLFSWNSTTIYHLPFSEVGAREG